MTGIEIPTGLTPSFIVANVIVGFPRGMRAKTSSRLQSVNRQRSLLESLRKKNQPTHILSRSPTSRTMEDRIRALTKSSLAPSHKRKYSPHPSCPKIQTNSKTHAPGRRRVHLSLSWRAQPSRAWQRVCVFGHDEVGRNLTDPFDGFLRGKRFLILDRDKKFTTEFRDLLEHAGTDVIRLPHRSPNLNAYVERFVLSRSRASCAFYLFGSTRIRVG